MKSRALTTSAIFGIKLFGFVAIPSIALYLNAACHTSEAAITFVMWSSILSILFWVKAGARGGDEGTYFDEEQGIFFRDTDGSDGKPGKPSDPNADRLHDAGDFYPLSTKIAGRYFPYGGDEKRDFVQKMVVKIVVKLTNPKFDPERGTTGYVNACAKRIAMDIFRETQAAKRGVAANEIQVSQHSAYQENVTYYSSQEDRLFGSTKPVPAGKEDDARELIAALDRIRDNKQKAVLTASCVREGLIDNGDVAGILVEMTHTNDRERITISYTNAYGPKTESMLEYGLALRLEKLRDSAGAQEIKRIMIERLDRPAPGIATRQNQHQN